MSPEVPYADGPELVKLRIVSGQGEWFLDAVSVDGRHSLDCWSFDTWAEAVSAMSSFVALMERSR